VRHPSSSAEDEMGIKACRFLLANNDEQLRGISARLCSLPAVWEHSNPIINPWPFRGWGLDFIGEIKLSLSKGHRFVLVASDYFMKWTEVVPLKNMTHKEVIIFVLEHIIHRFGVPQTLTTDQGAAFMSGQFKDFTGSLRIKLLNSMPYYA
jgi:hypothetical protein